MLFVSVSRLFCSTLDPRVLILVNLVKDPLVVERFLVRENVVTLLRLYILVLAL